MVGLGAGGGGGAFSFNFNLSNASLVLGHKNHGGPEAQNLHQNPNQRGP